jgi:hypothetical protein
LRPENTFDSLLRGGNLPSRKEDRRHVTDESRPGEVHQLRGGAALILDFGQGRRRVEQISASLKFQGSTKLSDTCAVVAAFTHSSPRHRATHLRGQQVLSLSDVHTGTSRFLKNRLTVDGHVSLILRATALSSKRGLPRAPTEPRCLILKHMEAVGLYPRSKA